MLKTTPFHARTAPLVRAQTWRRWAGHQVCASLARGSNRLHESEHRIAVTRASAAAGFAWGNSRQPSGPTPSCHAAGVADVRAGAVVTAPTTA
jgi:hypothetical protein